MSDGVKNNEHLFDHNVLSELQRIDHEIESFPLDKKTIPQIQLDLSNRVHTNHFLWRGQFSPELVEILLSTYSNKNSIILDPFVGGGTTLFESAYQSKSCYGVEINPSAYELSKTAHFANVPIQDRLNIISNASSILLDNCPQELSWLHTKNDMFIDEEKVNIFFKNVIEASKSYGEHERNFILNIIMRYYTLRKRKIRNKLFYSFNVHKNIVLRNIPYIDKEIKVFHNDARKMPLKDDKIDLILTSPPYINVFNYHQNYREIMELYRKDILEIAKSEIGSNRKNRGNRFLSVIQYSLDIHQCLNEMIRVLKKDGRIIIVIGRESKIMNISFDNYKIITALAVLCNNLHLISRQSRQFTTKFGKEIIEDILHFNINGKVDSLVSPVDVGKYYLNKALQNSNNIKHKLLWNAINEAENIKTSPLLFEHT